MFWNVFRNVILAHVNTANTSSDPEIQTSPHLWWQELHALCDISWIQGDQIEILQQQLHQHQ